MMPLNNKRLSVHGPGVQLPVGGVQRSYGLGGCLAMLKILLQLRRKDKEKISLIGGLDPFLKDETLLSLPEHLEQS